MKKIKGKIIEKTIDGEQVQILRLGFKADLKVVGEDDQKWIVEGYASVFGNVDSYFEVVDKGAFTEWLKDNFPRYPKFIWAHDWSRPLGPTLSAEEDQIGLKVRGELLKDVKDAREAYALIKSGAMTDLSFGFRVREDRMDQENGVRHLVKIDIYEWSPVLVGANPKATITGVKSVEGEDISEIPAEAIVDTDDEEAPKDDPAPEAIPPEDVPPTDPPAVNDDTDAADDTEAGKSGKRSEALAKVIEAERALSNALDALKAIEDESPASDSDTSKVGKLDGKDRDTVKAVKLILRDARKADKTIESIIFRAKKFNI